MWPPRALSLLLPRRGLCGRTCRATLRLGKEDVAARPAPMQCAFVTGLLREPSVHYLECSGGSATYWQITSLTAPEEGALFGGVPGTNIPGTWPAPGPAQPGGPKSAIPGHRMDRVRGQAGWASSVPGAGTADCFLRSLRPARGAASHLQSRLSLDILVLQRAVPEVPGPSALLIFGRGQFQPPRPEITNTDRALLSTGPFPAPPACPGAAGCPAPSQQLLSLSWDCICPRTGVCRGLPGRVSPGGSFLLPRPGWAPECASAGVCWRLSSCLPGKWLQAGSHLHLTDVEPEIRKDDGALPGGPEAPACDLGSRFPHL